MGPRRYYRADRCLPPDQIRLVMTKTLLGEGRLLSRMCEGFIDGVPASVTGEFLPCQS